MRIGLYCGLANNLYICAKALAKRGVNVCFIRDRGDRYPFSQPVWEDVACTLDYDKISEAAMWTWEQWEKWEFELGWEAPDWLVDPLMRESGDRSIQIRDNVGLVNKMIFSLLTTTKSHWRVVLKLMTACNILLVSGIEGSILALMSGKPFIILPHGGDIRTAAGLHPSHSYQPLRWLHYWMLLRLLRQAYKEALWIITGNPKVGLYNLGNTKSKFQLPSKIKRYFHPLPIKQHFSKNERLDLLSKTMLRLGMPAPTAEWIGLIPSRIDFFWKGQDIFFRALAQISEKEKIHVIVSGWGQDYHNAKTMVSPQHVTFLPCAVSKPILYDFYQGVDFVVDQFRIGCYSSSALQAMSCGTPVMIWLDEKLHRKRGWEPPPVLNAKDEEDIANILQGILSRQIDLEKYGRAAHNWVKQFNSEETAVPLLVEQFTAALSHIS